MSFMMFVFPLIVLLGWICGALVNYLADVLPWRRKLVAPFCTQCQKAVPWKDYLLWPRRCPACGERRTWRAWLVEVIYMAAAIWLWFSPPPGLGFILGLVVLVYFGVVVVIDMEHRLILHPVSIVGAVLGLGVGIYMNGIQETLIGGVVGVWVMWGFYKLGG